MNIFFIISLYFLISMCICQDGGIKIAINEKIIKSIIRYYSDEINKHIKYIWIGDVDNIKEINFGISNFDPDLIDIYFYQTNTIKVKISNIKARIHLVYTKTKFSTNVDVDITKFTISFKMKLNDKYYDGSLIPDLYIADDSYDISLDFDYHLSSILDWGIIRGILKNKVRRIMEDRIKTEFKNLLKEYLNKIPKKVAINENLGYYIDYSLISSLTIRNDCILINSYGLFYNKYIDKTKNRNNYELTKDLPDFDFNGKNFQIFIGDYAIKNMIYTLYESKALKYNLTSQFVGKKLNRSLNVGLIGNLYKGIEKIYDKEAKINIFFEAKSLPKVELLKEYIYLLVPVAIQIYIEGENNYILNYETNIELKGKIAIKENQYISGKILNIISYNTSIIENKLSDLTEKYLEEKFNLLAEVIKACGNFFPR